MFDLKESALNKENCKEVKWSGSALIYSKKKKWNKLNQRKWLKMREKGMLE